MAENFERPRRSEEAEGEHNVEAIRALGIVPGDVIVTRDGARNHIDAVVFNPDYAGGGRFKTGYDKGMSFQSVVDSEDDIRIDRFSTSKGIMERREIDRSWEEAREVWADFASMELAPGDVIRTRSGSERTITEVSFDASQEGGELYFDRRDRDGRTKMERIPMSDFSRVSIVARIENIERRDSRRIDMESAWKRGK